MPLCPICKARDFDTYGNRAQARCMHCGALERGRLSWMILEKLNYLRPDIRILNLAPEPFMLTFGRKFFGDNYVAADFEPELFSKWKTPILKLDLCADIYPLPERSFDVVMHNHVLEHLPCDVASALKKLTRLVAPGGVHMFSVPIMPDRRTIEDLSPTLTTFERRSRFGQEDHMRMFGELDIHEYINAADLTNNLIPLNRLFSTVDLEIAALPLDCLERATSHHVFTWSNKYNSDVLI